MTLMLIAARALDVASARLLHVGKLGLRQQQPESKDFNASSAFARSLRSRAGSPFVARIYVQEGAGGCPTSATRSAGCSRASRHAGAV